MKRALISVSDKSGLLEFASELVRMGFEIVSTGGTRQLLESENIPVIDVSKITDFPEALGGRVKTLHPHIHAGILARRESEEDMAFLSEQGIETIDLVVVNLYPFKDVISSEDSNLAHAIENIDIGGPSMLRAAAKNAEDVYVLTDPADYSVFLEAYKNQENLDFLRRKLQAKVFRHTAAYDSMIANYLSDAQLSYEKSELEMAKLNGDDHKFDYYEAMMKEEHNEFTMAFNKLDDLRYGENPHQSAEYFANYLATDDGLSAATQIQGKKLSYNNIQDANAAVEIIKEFDAPTVVAVKHANPCGVGSADTIEEAWELAYEADPVSIFGGIISCNREVSAKMAERMKGIFLEMIIAPAFSEGALEILSSKKNLRLLVLEKISEKIKAGTKRFTSIYGGLLVQDMDTFDLQEKDLQVVTKTPMQEGDFEKIKFAMRVVKHVKSNAITLSQGFQTVGVGPGQTNRITALKIAGEMAGEKAVGSILASDAFFPFDDSVRYAAKIGVRLIVQPGGSIRDEDSIKACDELGICMVFTGHRHFKH